jgi:hypothetical protein
MKQFAVSVFFFANKLVGDILCGHIRTNIADREFELVSVKIFLFWFV